MNTVARLDRLLQRVQADCQRNQGSVGHQFLSWDLHYYEHTSFGFNIAFFPQHIAQRQQQQQSMSLPKVAHFGIRAELSSIRGLFNVCSELFFTRPLRTAAKTNKQTGGRQSYRDDCDVLQCVIN